MLAKDRLQDNILNGVGVVLTIVSIKWYVMVITSKLFIVANFRVTFAKIAL